MTEINHRIKCAWYKFGLHSSTLCNHHISIKLRLKFFDAVVTPTILFGLAVLPLTQTSIQKILVTQRKMMRKMVGWVRIGDESWEVTMRRMKLRVENGLAQHPIMWWNRRIAKYLWKFALRVKTSPVDSLLSQSTAWEPKMIDDAFCEIVPYRSSGRRRRRWDDDVANFCRIHFNASWLSVPIEAFSASIDAFIEFCDLSS